jgi:NADH-quinone oxidoreductase subunit M
LISAALFLCVGVVYDRLHSRLISTYGGVVNYLPKYSLFFLIFALAALGLPGTSGFLGEFLVLTGTFQKSYLAAMLATFGVILGAAYMLWLTKRVIFGKTENNEIKNLKDINNLEIIMLLPLAFFVILFGFYPAPLMDTVNVSIDNLISNYQTDLVLNMVQNK